MFFRQMTKASITEVSKEWTTAGRSTLKRGMMKSRWKAAGNDILKMNIRDKLIRQWIEQTEKVWTWMTRDELLVRFNQNVEPVDSMIHVKKRDAL